MKKTLLTIIGLAAATLAGVNAQTVITQWNFQDAFNVGTTTPNVGSGTISLLGGVTTPGFNSGGGSSDPFQPGQGYQTQNYPAQSTGSGTAGVRFDVSTVGFSSPTYTGLTLTFDLRISNAASRWYRLDYTTDGGTNWTNGSPTRLGTAANAGDTWFNINTVTVNDLAALNNANFGFRVVSVFSPDAFTEANTSTNYSANTAYEVARNTTSTYGGGTWRFDMVTVEAIPEPSSMLLLGLGGLALLARRKFAARN